MQREPHSSGTNNNQHGPGNGSSTNATMGGQKRHSAIPRKTGRMSFASAVLLLGGLLSAILLMYGTFYIARKYTNTSPSISVNEYQIIENINEDKAKTRNPTFSISKAEEENERNLFEKKKFDRSKKDSQGNDGEIKLEENAEENENVEIKDEENLKIVEEIVLNNEVEKVEELPRSEEIIAPIPLENEGELTITESQTDPYNVTFTIRATDTLTDTVIIEIHPMWAPLGAARFLELMKIKYFQGNAFFRVIKNFMCQFGIHGNPEMQKRLNTRDQQIKDDPVMHTNARGTLSFACSGPDTRSTQMFINTAKNGNAYLDPEGFSPIGRVVEGMSVIDKIYSEYGEGGVGDGSDGMGPSQGKIVKKGNEYLNEYFPNLSWIVDVHMGQPVVKQ